MIHPTDTLPARLARIDDLTRRYARYSRHHSGLGAIWAGACLLLLGGAVVAFEIHRFIDRAPDDSGLGFWAFLIQMPPQSGPLWFLLLAVAMPLLWFGGNRWIRQRVYERAGVVVAPPVPADEAALAISKVLGLLLPGILLALVWLRFMATGHPETQLTGAWLATAIALFYPVLVRGLTSVLDRSALALLVVGCCTLAYGGGAESRLFCMASFAFLGIGAMANGLGAHRNFRRVMAELAELK